MCKLCPAASAILQVFTDRNILKIAFSSYSPVGRNVIKSKDNDKKTLYDLFD